MSELRGMIEDFTRKIALAAINGHDVTKWSQPCAQFEFELEAYVDRRAKDEYERGWTESLEDEGRSVIPPKTARSSIASRVMAR